MSKEFARVVWTPEDVMSKADDLEIPMTTEEAEAWLAKNGKYIAERMVERGWEAIETLLEIDLVPIKVECRFCHEMVPQPEAHCHDGHFVCESCWDERLRTTE